jgi:heterodisulfide reductase subunit C
MLYTRERQYAATKFMEYVRCEVFMAVTMKNIVLWYFTPCSSCMNRCFGGMDHLLHQSDRNRRARQILLVTSNRSTLAISCQHDDGGDTFLRNVGSYNSHTV